MLEHRQHSSGRSIRGTAWSTQMWTGVTLLLSLQGCQSAQRDWNIRMARAVSDVLAPEWSERRLSKGEELQKRLGPPDYEMSGKDFAAVIAKDPLLSLHKDTIIKSMQDDYSRGAHQVLPKSPEKQLPPFGSLKILVYDESTHFAFPLHYSIGEGFATFVCFQVEGVICGASTIRHTGQLLRNTSQKRPAIKSSQPTKGAGE